MQEVVALEGRLREEGSPGGGGCLRSDIIGEEGSPAGPWVCVCVCVWDPAA